jgi:hypothetical protein
MAQDMCMYVYVAKRNEVMKKRNGENEMAK